MLSDIGFLELYGVKKITFFYKDSLLIEMVTMCKLGKYILNKVLFSSDSVTTRSIFHKADVRGTRSKNFASNYRPFVCTLQTLAAIFLDRQKLSLLIYSAASTYTLCAEIFSGNS
jgi:hypothetical protein